MNAHEAKRQERADRLRARAERLRAVGEAKVDAARAIADRIPFGQPILVGHHSEKRARSDHRRINRTYDAGFAAIEESKQLTRRADAAESNRSISSDDPDALDKLRTKLAEVEARRSLMVAANKAARSKDPRGALKALPLSGALIEKILTPDFAGRIGFPAYALQNSAGEAARLRKRIADLEAKAASPVRSPVEINGATISEEDNRVRIAFTDRLSDSQVAALKASGFRWTRSLGVWQRMASNAAWAAAERAVAS